MQAPPTPASQPAQAHLELEAGLDQFRVDGRQPRQRLRGGALRPATLPRLACGLLKGWEGGCSSWRSKHAVGRIRCCDLACAAGCAARNNAGSRGSPPWRARRGRPTPCPRRRTAARHPGSAGAWGRGDGRASEDWCWMEVGVAGWPAAQRWQAVPSWLHAICAGPRSPKTCKVQVWRPHLSNRWRSMRSARPRTSS